MPSHLIIYVFRMFNNEFNIINFKEISIVELGGKWIIIERRSVLN